MCNYSTASLSRKGEPMKKYYYANAATGQNVQEPSDSVCSAVREYPWTVRGLSESVRADVRGRPWTWKSARNAVNNRNGMDILKHSCFLVSLSAALATTLLEQEPKTQIVAYLVFATTFCLLDPINALGRILAPQSRYLISICQILVIVGIFRPERGYIAVAGLLISGSVLAIRYLNASWLAAYNWMMSAAVQSALQIDADNRATRAWQSHGRRETKTLLYELGYDTDDDIIDILHRPVYIAGYLNGFEKTVKQKQRLGAAEENLEKYMQDCRELKEERNQLLKEAASIRKENDKLQASIIENENLYNNLQELYAASQAENRRLRTANEELLEDLPVTEETIKVSLSENEQIRRLLEQGKSIRQVADLLQIPKNRVEKVKKTANR